MSSGAASQVKGKLHALASKGADLARSPSAKKRREQDAPDKSSGLGASVAPRTTGTGPNGDTQSSPLHSPRVSSEFKEPSTPSAEETQTISVEQYSQWDLPSEQDKDTHNTVLGNDQHADLVHLQKQTEPPPPESEIPTSSGPEDEMAEKYVLRISAGPSYDSSTHVPVPVNSAQPTRISSKSMDLMLHVRIRDFSGLPRKSPASAASTPYFGAPLRKSDQYSIGFSFVPKRDINSEKLVWGNDFDHPVRDRLPPGFNYAFKIVKSFIDPGLECDAYADEPWLYGPALSCWFALDIGTKTTDHPSDDLKWPDVAKNGDIALDESDTAGLRKELGIPSTASKRRKHFLDAPARQAFTFEKGRVYSADFYNPYLDFNKFALRLPGFSLGVLKYIGEKTHTLRYVFKELGPGGPGDRNSGEVFLAVEMTLLFGDDAKKGIQEDDQRANRKQPDASQEQESGDDQPELTKQWSREQGFGQVGGATDMPNGDCKSCNRS